MFGISMFGHTALALIEELITARPAAMKIANQKAVLMTIVNT